MGCILEVALLSVKTCETRMFNSTQENGLIVMISDEM